MTTQTMTRTLGQLISAHGVDVLEHLDRDLEVPVLGGLQFQGDLAVIPTHTYGFTGVEVPAEGIAIIEAVGGGHEHRLLPGAPGTVTTSPSGMAGRAGTGTAERLNIACVTVTDEPAYLAHPEHGYLGLAPGSYILRRQREQAEEERIVAD